MATSRSYWEDRFLSWPVIVIGSGITGLSAARHLAAAGVRVLVLERGLLPSGASTRNAGFACFGSVSELLEDLETLSEDALGGLVERRWSGLCQLRQRFGADALGWDPHGGVEVIPGDPAPLFDAIPRLNDLLRPIFGDAVFSAGPAAGPRLGFRQGTSLIHNIFEAGIHTGALMQALLADAREAGAEIWTGASVDALEELGSGVRLTLGGMQLHASTVLVCTNGLTPSLLPDLDVVPARGQILLTSPIPGLKLRGVAHLDRGYTYFREIDGRVLLGGARNHFRDAEQTASFGTTASVQSHLEDLLRELILPQHADVTIERRWSGIMGIGATREPLVAQVSPSVHVAVRLGGMGVALGAEVGRLGGQAVLENQ